MKQIDLDHKFTLTFSENDRLFLQLLFRSRQIDIEKEIDKAKNDNNEYYITKRLMDFVRLLKDLLDQIDEQVKEAKTEENE